MTTSEPPDHDPGFDSGSDKGGGVLFAVWYVVYGVITSIGERLRSVKERFSNKEKQ